MSDTAQFTKGEWYVGEICPLPRIKSGGFIIATCGNHFPIEEREANAKLLAAAPEMLEVLQNIAAYEERGRAKGEPRISDKWYNEIKAAIKKATS